MLAKVYKMGNKMGLFFSKARLVYSFGTLVLLTITKNNEKISFITKMNYNIIIRKKFVRTLNIKKDDTIDIKLEKIKNLKRGKRMFCNNAIDLLYFIPEKTSMGYEIIVNDFIKDDKKWLRIWYSHKRGSGRQLELKRFVDIRKFGSLLGQYQAEGTKNKNTKSKFMLRFTNKIIKEHVAYLSSLRAMGVQEMDIEINLNYDTRIISEEEAGNIADKFKIETGIVPKLTKDKYSKGWCFSCVFRNTIITEIILYSMNYIRTLLADKKSKNNNTKKLFNIFLAKLLTGDGTLDININSREYGYPAAKIKIVDQDIVYLNDYKNILQNAGFIPRIKERDIVVIAACGIKQLFYLYNIKAFYNSNNWYKLLIVIDMMLGGRRLSTLKRYIDLVGYKSFYTTQLTKKYGITTHSAYVWLKNATENGFVTIIKRKNEKECCWKTTNKAKALKMLLTNWQEDFNKVKKKVPECNSKELLEVFKLRKQSRQTSGSSFL